MKPSDKKLLKNLGYDTKWYQQLEYWYIDYPIISDLIISAIFIAFNIFYISYLGPIFWTTDEALTDLNNELVSTSLSSGGFVLAALAIVATIKEGVRKIGEGEKPATGKEFFYNSKGYRNVLKIYSISCFIFLLLFVYFSLLRSLSSMLNGSSLVAYLIVGVVVLASSFIRCIWVLWKLIRLK